MKKRFFDAFAISFFLVFTFATVAFSQTSPGNFPGIKISNFGQMDQRFYRGARPKGKDLPALKALGVSTVIDLTEESKGEQEAVEAAGMKYVHIPIADGSYPSEESVDAFLRTVDNPSTGIFYLHCVGGRHRTGDMGALYRFTKYGWSFDQAYQEMLNYDFYTANGHQKAKDFVVDYAAKMDAQRSATATVSAEKPLVLVENQTNQQPVAPVVKVNEPVTITNRLATPAAIVEKSAAPSVQTPAPAKKSTKLVGSRRHRNTTIRHSSHNA